MKRIGKRLGAGLLSFVLFVFATFSSITLRAQATDPAVRYGQEIVIRGGWLFTGTGDARVRNTGIVVRNGKFLEVGADLTGRDLSQAQVIALGDDVTILPGMFDMHAHHNMALVGGGRVDEFNYNPIIWLANGVTSTWPAGEFNPEGMMEARKRIDSGKQIGARLFNSGPYFGAARCQGSNNHLDSCKAWPKDITEQQIRDEVDYWADRGVRSFKIKLASPEQMRIVIDQAHKHGLTTSSHLQSEDFHQDVDPRDAIQMGLDRIEHSIAPIEDVMNGKFPVGSPELKAIFDMMVSRNVYYDATMRVYGASVLGKVPELRTHWTNEAAYFTPFTQTLIETRAANFARRNPDGMPQHPPAGSLRDFPALFKHKVPELKAFYDAGGARLITVGTDDPTGGPDLAGFAYHRELQALVYAGMPPVAVLKSATINGARALGVGDHLGSIEPGKWADLYVATGNPLEHIEDARNVRLVMKAGIIYDAKDLLKSVEGKIGPASAADVNAWQAPKE
jgi:imidazolonepropionase-like amidohydrolase